MQGRRLVSSQLLPELKELVSGVEPPVVELAAARFRLYQSVTGLLRHVAAARPLLVVIDDLHWADTGSLELLAFLAAELRVLSPGGAGHLPRRGPGGRPAATETLGALARERMVERIRLRGLGKAEVVRLIVTTTGSRPPERAGALHDRTEGNPFFVTELLRLLQSEGTSRPTMRWLPRRAIPAGVREVLQGRLARLPGRPTPSCWSPPQPAVGSTSTSSRR